VTPGFNLNGIAATPDGSTLIVAHSNNAAVYSVNPSTGASALLAGDLPNVDGILFEAGRLWAVQNFLNQIIELRVPGDLSSATVERVITNADVDGAFGIPTTVARFGNVLATVNAHFDTGFPPPPQPFKHQTQTPPDSTQANPADANVLLEIVLAVLRIAGWTILVLAVLLSPFLAVIVAKRRRRTQRRRAPHPADRMSGGWQEFEDAVIDHGYPTPPSPTRTEVAAVVGGMQPLVLASVADRGVFSPDVPSDEEIERLWRSVQDLRISLDDGLTRWQRIKALVSVRSLGGYSVKKLFKR